MPKSAQTVIPPTLNVLLKRDIKNKMIKPSQAKEVKKQQRMFERSRIKIERTLRGRYVAYAGGKQYVGDAVSDLISQIDRVNSKLLMYAERVL